MCCAAANDYHLTFKLCADLKLKALYHCIYILFCYLLRLKTVLHIFFVICICLIGSAKAQAQYKIQGTVYDSSRTYPLEAVSVLSTSGKGTITNREGFYQIEASAQDSIYFSYLGKPTVKFPVRKITNVSQFDLALRVPVSVLKEVTVKPRNYKLDSIQNRKDYQKVFDYRRPNVESMTSIGPMGAGIDINELIRLFQFRKNKSTMRFQQRLLQQERDKFIDHRFSKALVLRLTGLTGEEQQRFMLLFRPSYEFALYASDYDFQAYIREAAVSFKRGKAF